VADLDRDGLAEYDFLVDGTSAPNLAPSAVPDRLAADVDAIDIGTLGLILEPMASTLAEFALRERAGRLLMIDPNVRPGLVDESYRDRLNSLIRASTVVKASDRDLTWLYPDRDYAAAAADLLAQGVSTVVVTLGADGAFGAHRDLRVRVAAPPVEVVDTIGAGDAFGAGILAWLHDHHLIRSSLVLSRDQLRSALDYACLVASLTVARAGADPPWKRELIPA